MTKSQEDRPNNGSGIDVSISSSINLAEPLLDQPQDDEQSQHQQERRMVPFIDGMTRKTSYLLKSLYFLSGLGASTWGRFATIYYNLHGIGLLEGLMPVVRSISQPFWAFLADGRGIGFASTTTITRKQVYLFCRIMGTATLLTLALPWVSKSVYRIFLVSLLTVSFSASGILDAYTLDLLGKDHKAKYGRYRVYTAISWGLGAVIMGYITDQWGFEPNFILYGLLGAISIALTAAFVPNKTEEEEQRHHDVVAESPLSGNTDDPACFYDLVIFLCRPRVLVFLSELIVMGAGMGTVERLLLLYLVNDLGASTFLCGLSVGVTVLLEIPLFWWSKLFLERLGHDGMVAVAMLCFVVRVYGYTWLTPSTVYFVLLLEIMHGITFALFWTAIMDISKTLSLQIRGWDTTIPVIVSTLFNCLGVGSGSVIGGWAMQRYGARTMYVGSAGIVLLTFIVHMLGSIMSRFCFNQRSCFLPSPEEQECSGGQNTEEQEQDEEVEALVPPRGGLLDDTSLLYDCNDSIISS